MRSDLYSQMYLEEEYYWWHRAKRNLVKRFLPATKALKILDIGCGTGKLLEELQLFGQVWGIDADKTAVKYCHQRGLRQVYQEKFPTLRRRYPQFDVITCLDVLEHIKNDRLALRTIKRLLKPGGKLIVTVPAYSWLFSYWDAILDHYHRYNYSQVKRIFTTEKFHILKLSYLFSFLLPLAIPFRLIRQQLFKQTPPRSDFIAIPRPLHQLLLRISLIEQSLLRYINLPFGLSIVCVAHKL